MKFKEKQNSEKPKKNSKCQILTLKTFSTFFVFGGNI